MNQEKIKLGSDLRKDQLDALKSVSPTGNDILEHLEDFNEEIQESTKRLPESKPMKKNTQTTATPGSSKMVRTNPKQRKTKTIQREEIMEPQDLNDELEALERQLAAKKAEQAAQVEVEEPATPEDGMKNQILDALGKLKNAPSDAQINAWKQQRGRNSVYVMAFSESDVYIYSFLTRGQHQKIQEIVRKAQETGDINIENMLKEKVVQNCVLWPKPLPVEFFYNSRAGIVDGLYEAIMIQSGFLSPQQLMLLTTQL